MQEVVKRYDNCQWWVQNSIIDNVNVTAVNYNIPCRFSNYLE